MHIKSPMNYTGGKHKLLPQILSIIPSDIEGTFIDLFAGGLSVSLNVNAETIKANDVLPDVIEFYKLCQNHPVEKILNSIKITIERYALTDTNKPGYLSLRETFNQLDYPNHAKTIIFYVLLCHGFNNQIRFNASGKFNMPFGERCFNKKMKEKFVSFAYHIKELDIDFSVGDFSDIYVLKSDFVYADPPYLLSCATYNSGWNSTDEHRLLNYLAEVDNIGAKFALSNCIEMKGAKHTILTDWVKRNKFTMHMIEADYSSCSYQRKDRETTSVEVLVTNY